MVARTAQAPTGQVGSSLTLSWALGELRKQLGGGSAQLEAHLQRTSRTHGAHSRDGPASCERELAASPEQSTSSMNSTQAPLGCMTPGGFDSSLQSSAEQHRVHWAAALEQQASQRAHAPQHARHTPDKPCLKVRQSSFPFVEEAAQLEGLMRRPRTLVSLVSHLSVCGDGDGDGEGSSPAAQWAKKRSRLAAFGQ